MRNALDYNLNEWQEIAEGLSQPKFRAKQIVEWLYKGVDFDKMVNLPSALKERLKEDYYIGVEIYGKAESHKDDTVKYLFKLRDGNIIEGVLMRYKYGNTVCISTQVGCRMNCAFCASGLDGLIRHLTAGEIIGQVLAVNSDIGGGERNITNVVLMGSGEPLDNYDNVIKFLTYINAYMGISRRNISLSTCGLCDRIYSLAEDGGGVTLTISLHASNDSVRDDIMPINKKYKIADIMKAVRYYFDKTGRRIIFEYSMISGKNDKREHAIELAALVKGLPCHINLINLNYVKEKGLKGSAKDSVKEFRQTLEDLGVSVTIRRVMGSDIDGACGQLRRRVLSESSEVTE